MKAFCSVEGRAAILPVDNIDTDRIFPARFLKTTNRRGLGRHLFADWPEGRRSVETSEIVIAGNNFGCGSSREHAVWTLMDSGIRVVISTGFADIFHANALRSGLALVVLEPETLRKLLQLIESDAEKKVRVDLENQTLQCGSIESRFDFDAFAKHCMLKGLDELGYLLDQTAAIDLYEERRAQRVNTAGRTP